MLRLALDQNFPVPLLQSLARWLPPDIELTHVRAIDPRLSEVSDRELLIALKQLGYDGLVTDNYRMLNIPSEVAAMIATKATVIAVKSLGHDPIRAAGALLLELPGLANRLKPNVSNVFELRPPAQPKDAWFLLGRPARQAKTTSKELLSLVKVTDLELTTPVLDPN